MLTPKWSPTDFQREILFNWQSLVLLLSWVIYGFIRRAQEGAGICQTCMETSSRQVRLYTILIQAGRAMEELIKRGRVDSVKYEYTVISHWSFQSWGGENCSHLKCVCWLTQRKSKLYPTFMRLGIFTVWNRNPYDVRYYLTWNKGAAIFLSFSYQRSIFQVIKKDISWEPRLKKSSKNIYIYFIDRGRMDKR